MNSNTSRIDRRYAGWSNDSNLLGKIFSDIFKKGCFTRTRLARKKNITGALIYQFNGQLKHFICGIVIHSAVAKLNKRNIAAASSHCNIPNPHSYWAALVPNISNSLTCTSVIYFLLPSLSV